MTQTGNEKTIIRLKYDITIALYTVVYFLAHVLCIIMQQRVWKVEGKAWVKTRALSRIYDTNS